VDWQTAQLAADGGDSHGGAGTEDGEVDGSTRNMGDILRRAKKRRKNLPTEGTEGRRGNGRQRARSFHQQRTRRAQKKDKGRTEVISWVGVGLGLGHLGGQAWLISR